MFKTGTQISGYPEIWSQEGLKSETKINFQRPSDEDEDKV